ncbi:hypothetical protein [Chitinophaga ginsengisoli]|uniref:Uncharacterized protein n=1 Tax=Chitinophaga ginsengisoli TaxID=363837 RepID=A0A2P8GHR2_9BACT|nr:hypothetical protein [Chitinophaga ginsengisoli]PSL33477.1 hypothetical protein CLV42_103460 [Chitinophaga ginsengisoli]
MSYPHKHTPAVAPGIRTASQASANNIGTTGIARPAVQPKINPAFGTPVIQPLAQRQLPNHVAQLKLRIKDRDTKRSDLNLVLTYIQAKKDRSDFYVRLGIKKPKGNAPYLYAASVYRKLRRVHPSVPKMLSQLKKWAAEKGTYKYNSWDEAGAEAYRVAHEAQKASKLHPLSPLGSPLTDEQDEYVTHLNGPGRIAEHMKTNAKWNELKIHGQIGEYGHQQLLTSTGVPYRDANDLLGYNMAGLDTISNTPTPFGQSKMHLGTTESPEEMVRVYTAHINRAPEYAKIFLTKLFAATNPGQVMRDKLIELNKTWKNDDISKLNSYGRKKEWRVKKGEESPLEPNFVDGEVEQTAPVQLIVDGMIFPVPSDVYDLIPTNLLGWFERLPYDLNWYRKVKSQMEYRFNKPPKSEEDKDPTYKG